MADNKYNYKGRGKSWGAQVRDTIILSIIVVAIIALAHYVFGF